MLHYGAGMPDLVLADSADPARGILSATGRLPVDLKFVVEGEEEVGSAHFEAAS
ncbi:MAG: hypothetical protein M3063_14630 [Actinomycetota bacterium]|nr:hypothetical protein [Actinomycetota bacterium]